MSDPFEVGVVASPGGDLAVLVPRDMNLSQLAVYDEEMVKPALLYADKVTLYSFRRTISDGFWNEGRSHEFAVAAVNQYIRLLRQSSDEQITAELGVDVGAVPPREMARQEDPLAAHGGSPLEFFRDYAEEIGILCRAYSEYLRPGWESMKSDNLRRAEGAGLLTVLPWYLDAPIAPEPGVEIWERGVAELSVVLDDVDCPLFMDPASAEVLDDPLGAGISAIARKSIGRLQGLNELQFPRFWIFEVS